MKVNKNQQLKVVYSVGTGNLMISSSLSTSYQSPETTFPFGNDVTVLSFQIVVFFCSTT